MDHCKPIKNDVLVDILKALKQSPAGFNITLLTCPTSTSHPPEGFEVLRYDFDDEALVEEFRKRDVDAVVCAVGSDATLGQLGLIDSAVKAGVRWFVPTEFASDTLNPVLPTLNSWYADKRTIHDRLVSLSASYPEFAYTCIISRPFFTWGITSGFFRYDLEKKSAEVYDGGELRVSYSKISQVGLAVARALEKGGRGYLHISSVSASQNEILDALEKSTAGRRWESKEESTQ